MKAICQACKGDCTWIDCPTGGWWAHDVHPADEHDAVPGEAVIPEWVLGLIGAIQQHEDQHDKGAPCLYDLLSLVPIEVRERSTTVPTPGPDTLPKWLQKRYGHGLAGGDDYDAHVSFWQHEADAVRRATGRGGFKLPEVKGSDASLKSWAEDFVARGGVTPVAVGELTPAQQAQVIDEFASRMGLMDLGTAVVVHMRRTPLIHRTPRGPSDRMPCCGNSIYSLTGYENKVTSQDAEVTCTPDKWVRDGDIAVHRTMGAGEPLRCCGKYNGPYTTLTQKDHLVTCLGDQACPESADQRHCSHYTEAEDDCCGCGRAWESPVLTAPGEANTTYTVGLAEDGSFSVELPMGEPDDDGS